MKFKNWLEEKVQGIYFNLTPKVQVHLIGQLSTENAFNHKPSEDLTNQEVIEKLHQVPMTRSGNIAIRMIIDLITSNVVIGDTHTHASLIDNHSIVKNSSDWLACFYKGRQKEIVIDKYYSSNSFKTGVAEMRIKPEQLPVLQEGLKNLVQSGAAEESWYLGTSVIVVPASWEERQTLRTIGQVINYGINLKQLNARLKQGNENAEKESKDLVRNYEKTIPFWQRNTDTEGNPNSVTNAQVKQLDLDKIDQAYKRPGVNPLGDCYIPNIKNNFLL